MKFLWSMLSLGQLYTDDANDDNTNNDNANDDDDDNDTDKLFTDKSWLHRLIWHVCQMSQKTLLPSVVLIIRGFYKHKDS